MVWNIPLIGLDQGTASVPFQLLALLQLTCWQGCERDDTLILSNLFSNSWKLSVLSMLFWSWIQNTISFTTKKVTPSQTKTVPGKPSCLYPHSSVRGCSWINLRPNSGLFTVSIDRTTFEDMLVRHFLAYYGCICLSYRCRLPPGHLLFVVPQVYLHFTPGGYTSLFIAMLLCCTDILVVYLCVHVYISPSFVGFCFTDCNLSYNLSGHPQDSTPKWRHWEQVTEVIVCCASSTYLFLG